MATRDRLVLRNIYLYLVCLISLVITIFAAVNLVSALVELLYPDPGYPFYEPVKNAASDPADTVARVAAALNSARRQSILALVSAGTTLLIAVPVYFYHWRRVQRENKPVAEPAHD